MYRLTADEHNAMVQFPLQHSLEGGQGIRQASPQPPDGGSVARDQASTADSPHALP